VSRCASSSVAAVSSSTCSGSCTAAPVLRGRGRRQQRTWVARPERPCRAPVVQPRGDGVRRQRALEARGGRGHRLARVVVPGEPGAVAQQRHERHAAHAERLGHRPVLIHVNAVRQADTRGASGAKTRGALRAGGRTGRRAVLTSRPRLLLRRTRQPRARTLARTRCTGHTCAATAGAPRELQRCGATQAARASDAPACVKRNQNRRVSQRRQQRLGVQLRHSRAGAVRTGEQHQQRERTAFHLAPRRPARSPRLAVRRAQSGRMPALQAWTGGRSQLKSYRIQNLRVRRPQNAASVPPPCLRRWTLPPWSR